MRKAKGVRWISVVCLMLGFGSVAAAGPTTTAQRCGADQSKPPSRVFADPEGEHAWKEYPSANDVPQLSLDVGMVNAGMWVGSGGKLLFRTRQPGQDYEAYTDYCFDSKGQLIQLRYELRTAWGWGYRKEGPVVNRVLKPAVSEYFLLESDQPTKKPADADGLPWATKPKIYLRQSELPFVGLMSK